MKAEETLRLDRDNRRIEAYTLFILTGFIARSPFPVSSDEIIKLEKTAKYTARRIVKG